MPSSAKRFRPLLVVLLGIGWLLLALMHPHGPGITEYIALGLMLGSMFAYGALAGAWTALGPMPLVWRLPLSLAWLGLTIIALLLNRTMPRGPPDVFALVFGGCMLGIWFLVQMPLWGLAVGYGVRVRHREETVAAGKKESQFGIRQLIIVTAIIGVALGLGRMAVVALAPRFQGFSGEGPVFAFLAIASVLMTVPLILAALLPRRALIATVAALVLIAAATAWELPLLSQVSSLRGGGPDFWHFAFINGFQTFWILAILIAMRVMGYRLTVFRDQAASDH